MRLRGLLFLILTVLYASGVHAGEEVRITPEVPGYLALPAETPETAKVPAVLLVHEWWGLNDQIRTEADKFAAQGFAALAVDLYRGRAATSPDEAHELMRGLPDDRALADMKSALDFMAAHPRSMGKTGVIGWCMGGGYALKLAVADERVAALNIYYGKLITDETELARLKAPVLGIFGGEDRGISKESVLEFKSRLEKLGKRSEILLYLRAGHAFANPQNPGYRREDAEQAWQKTLEFFKASLI